jgi:zinc and cadmium transporter
VTVLAHIVGATLIGGLVSILIAAQVSFSALGTIVRRLVSLSIGLLLATAVINILPEAMSSGANVHHLSWTLLAGILFLLCLEKLAVFRHSHHHEGDGHDHYHGHDQQQAGSGGIGILLGDSVHNFTDGIMVAAAFMTDIKLGWITAAAVAAHEIPQEIGDFIVLLNAGYTRSRALLFNLISGFASVLGGLCGYFLIESTRPLLPFMLMVTVASFIYVALADLIPSMHQSRTWKDSAERLGLLALGVGVVVLLSSAHH